MTESKEYEPYGSEWENEMKKFKKTELISMLRRNLERSCNTRPKGEEELVEALGNLVDIVSTWSVKRQDIKYQIDFANEALSRYKERKG